MIEAPWLILLMVPLLLFQLGLLFGSVASASLTLAASKVVTVLVFGLAAVQMLSLVLS